jgi:PhnB protein
MAKSKKPAKKAAKRASKPAKARKPPPIPEGYTDVTPYLIVKGAAEALEFYQKAFGARTKMRLNTPDGSRIMHAEMLIGKSHVFLGDEWPDMGARGPHALGGTPVTVHLYVKDCDACFAGAIAAGATPLMPPADMFWGDRFAKLVDPFGHQWSVATHIEDVRPAEMTRRAAAWAEQMKSQSGTGGAQPPA